MLAQLSEADLLLINNALNEVCNGVAIPSGAFATRLGASREQALYLLTRIQALLGAVAAKRTDEGQEEFEQDFGRRAPDLATVFALAEDAIGPANQDLRGALHHYGTIRHLAPSWLEALDSASACRDALPDQVRQIMFFMLR